ncbi:tRNA1(Val) (adenine(37)-N6)-methyltransferase [Acidisphaera sp. L21]|uniref:tRNA1(Val) (adenine(37)-N6)-methyltransferase n=1 Tax=Acidisphaera sp. L21 TaxID=1641851 RepID=UPI0020B1136C|nr:methyltransferase [Acidisphaera sp. L21]
MTTDSISAGFTLTQGTLLGGRVTYRQPSAGYRTGIEPVLLAASVAARPGERVVEGGTGAGAGVLCLAARLPGVIAIGVERDAALAQLAQANIEANGFALARVDAGDIRDLPAEPRFDHAIANPPWHEPLGTASPTPMREAAKRATPGLLEAWTGRLGRSLRQGGTLTLLVPATLTAQALDAVTKAGCGGATLLPLWPRPGQEARLLLLRATKTGRGPCRILPGLVLHEGDGFSAEARAILWEGAALTWR